MTSNLYPEDVRVAARMLRDARAVAVSTGAGMSAESGLATFRDADGVWSKFNPSELATPHAFARNPTKVWEWYRLRRQNLASVTPHAGHEVLARWERRYADFTLITQNVDGLHERAGSKRLIELHGRLDQARCVQCGYTIQGLDDLGPDPCCPACYERMRPGVVWFGEPLPEGAFEKAATAANRCDLFLVIGTSGVVEPAASLARIAREGGAAIIEINPNRTEITSLADLVFRVGSRDTLTAIDLELQQLTSRK